MGGWTARENLGKMAEASRKSLATSRIGVVRDEQGGESSGRQGHGDRVRVERWQDLRASGTVRYRSLGRGVQRDLPALGQDHQQ